MAFPYLELYNPAGLTTAIQPYGRTSGLAVGSPLTGVPDGTDPTLYSYNMTAIPAGDYTVQLAGVSTPNGPRFPLRKTDIAIYIADSWAEINTFAPDPDIPTSPANQVTGFWKIYDKDGVLEVGARVHLRVSDVPEDSRGLILEDTIRQAVSDDDGIVSFTGLFPGVTYIVNRASSGRKQFFTIAEDAESPVALGSLVG